MNSFQASSKLAAKKQSRKYHENHEKKSHLIEQIKAPLHDL